MLQAQNDMTNLPDFTDPPIDEVVLGIQFDAVPAFRSMHISSVWDLFRDEFPRFEDVPPLEPQLEIFGGGQSHLNVSFGNLPFRPRSWFISDDDTHLVQFQDDRLLLNWRKRPSSFSGMHPYPRYEAIADRFLNYIDRLDLFFLQVFDSPLRITQAEVSYINAIPTHDISRVSDYLNFIDTRQICPEGFAANFVERLTDESGKPVARMYHELQTAGLESPVATTRFTLTVRGKPSDHTSISARQFLDFARHRIVTRFCELTTTEAHEKWGREL